MALFNKMICSEILKKNPSKLLQNFCRHILSIKSSENLVEQFYSALLSRPLGFSRLFPSYSYNNVITLTLHNNTEVKIDYKPFLRCINSCGIPLKNIKDLKAKCFEITEDEWEALYIQTRS